MLVGYGMYVKLTSFCDICYKTISWENGPLVKGRISEMDVDFVHSFKVNGLIIITFLCKCKKTKNQVWWTLPLIAIVLNFQVNFPKKWRKKNHKKNLAPNMWPNEDPPPINIIMINTLGKTHIKKWSDQLSEPLRKITIFFYDLWKKITEPNET